MSGGLMQLVAYGSQDVYLTGEPQITFFKGVYRRHTNFAMESVQQDIQGRLVNDSRVTVVLSRSGDLLTDIELQIPVKTGTEITADTYPFRIVREAEIQIGGQLIDRIYGDWMKVWADIALRTNPDDDDKIVAIVTARNRTNSEHIHIPLLFWFHKCPALAIPLIALQYHDVQLFFTLDNTIQNPDIGPNSELANADIANTTVWANYVYLDTAERRKFAQLSHEYLINQNQRLEVPIRSSKGVKMDLTLNHPVSSLLWYASEATNAIALLQYRKAKIVIDGRDRFSIRPSDYFQKYQLYKHFKGVNLLSSNLHYSVYSFAINGWDCTQPSGTCNFSRIDNAQLIIEEGIANSGGSAVTSGTLTLHARNYNILRIQSGMGGLAYSN
jgi:hypothetical protein